MNIRCIYIHLCLWLFFWQSPIGGFAFKVGLMQQAHMQVSSSRVHTSCTCTTSSLDPRTASAYVETKSENRLDACHLDQCYQFNATKMHIMSYWCWAANAGTNAGAGGCTSFAATVLHTRPQCSQKTKLFVRSVLRTLSRWLVSKIGLLWQAQLQAVRRRRLYISCTRTLRQALTLRLHQQSLVW